MNTTLWIIQSILAVFFIMPGYGKLFSSKEQHIADGHINPESSVILIRILGVLEWLGCLGIIAPWLFGIVPILTPSAALGFSLIMLSGMIVHFKKKEYKMLPMLFIVFIFSVTVAYFRFSALLRI